MINLVVQLRADSVAHFLAGRRTRGGIGPLLDDLHAAGVSLTPMHPGEQDPELSTWFSAQIEDVAKADALAKRLLRHKSVVSAYPKPLDELP